MPNAETRFFITEFRSKCRKSFKTLHGIAYFAASPVRPGS
jgi:hypothetical protein